MKFSRKTKYLFLLFLLIAFFAIYWLKSEMGINFFSSFSLHATFPFKYFNNHIVESPEPSVILSDNFNNIRLFKNFPGLWMGEKGTVESELSLDGFNGTRCFLVKNSGNRSWSSSYRKTVKVKKGDLYYMEGLVKLDGDKLHAYLSVSAFDKNKDVIDWNFFKVRTDETGRWIKIQKQFDIRGENIGYIRFRLTGVGKGEFRFDNIIFSKLNYSE